jgi:hypothetical protein
MASLPYALVRPAKRGPRLGAVVALIALLGVLTGAAYGIRALAGRSRSTHDGVGLPTPSSSAPAPDPQLGTGPLSLAAIPIRADELPGWQVMPPDPDTEDQAADAGMNRCLGQRANASAPIVEQSETDYQLGPYSISSQAERMPSQAAVKADLAPIHDPKLKTCVQRWFRRDFAHAAPGAHLTSLNVEIVPGSHGGPASIAGTMSIQCLITVNGATRTVFLTTTVITGRRIESQVTFTGVNAPVDAGLQQRLVTAVALRTAQA